MSCLTNHLVWLTAGLPLDGNGPLLAAFADNLLLHKAASASLLVLSLAYVFG